MKNMMLVASVWFFCVLIGNWVGDELAIWLHRPADELRYQAIERGYALYCPTDGEFAWKGECEEE